MSTAVLATLFVVIGAIPLAHYLTAGRRDHQLDGIRSRLRRGGWICMQRGMAGELWGRELSQEQSRRCADNRFVIPAKIGPFTLDGLERDLAKIEKEDRCG